MLMGAKNGNTVLQRMIEDLRRPVWDCTDPFFDDMIIGSGTEDMLEDELIKAHQKELTRVLDVLDCHQMVCNPTKASSFVREVECAGQEVGHALRRLMPGELAALTHGERTKTISELQSFMAFCNCYSGYIRIYAQERSGPLHKMLQVAKFDLRKGSKKQLALTAEAEEVFKTIN